MSELFIIGISDDSLTKKQQSALSTCNLMVGGRRFKSIANSLGCNFIPITPLDKSFSIIRENLKTGSVAVLASGDPLFYGIGKNLIEEFSDSTISILPALSSIQKGCALFQVNWDDAKVTSLHGRVHPHVAGLLLTHYKQLIFTDKRNSPDNLAKKIIKYCELIGSTLPDTIKIKVAENIGSKDERIFSGSLDECSKEKFSPLNVCLIEIPTRQNKVSIFGLKESEISHSRGLITKNEVRAAALHTLNLPKHGVLWDIGGGSGSISIEAARLNPELTVYTIEQKAEELQNIKTNINKHCCFNVIPVSGKAPEALASLPAPDCVFIGGSGGAIEDIIDCIAKVLSPNGTLVVNSVLQKTEQEALRVMKKNDFTVSQSTISVTRCDHNQDEIQETQFNPITILAGKR